MLHISELRCEYLNNPIGIGVRRPRISWKLESQERGAVQTAYRIQVSGDGEFGTVLGDTGTVESDRSVHVVLPLGEAASRTRYYYRVRVWDGAGEASAWSEAAFFETGLLDRSEWKAEWIGAPGEALEQEGQVPYLRAVLQVDGEVAEARLYATALGLYEMEINGRRVGDGYFTPGWTSYKHRLQVQTYDITEHLREGRNGIGACLANGWYKGVLGWEGKASHYGSRTALLAQIHVRYRDGREQVLATDGSWKAAGSPILMSELYDGETYDARLELEGWSTAGFDDSGWLPVETVEQSLDVLVAQENVPVRKQERLKPVVRIITPEGDTLLDMGQNMVGWVQFNVHGEAGRTVEIHHAEVLDQAGNFYTDNIRKAKQSVRYTLKGGEPETFEPHFTFQGFRYIRLVGFPDTVRPEDFTGVVLHSDMEETGQFACSDPLVNQLQHNIRWGLKGNFLDVPTDCPQRDERLGWTGDAQVFARTAAYLCGTAPFFGKWLRDLAAEQAELGGGVPFVVPNVLGPLAHSSAAWGDAAVIIPWTLYQAYGDLRILEEQFESMKSWVESIRRQGDNEYLWNTGFHFGDWLALDSRPDSYMGATERDFVATAFYAYSTSLVVRAAEALGREEDRSRYAELHGGILKAFGEEFLSPNGRLTVPTQTGQVLALMFELAEGRAKERAVAKLLQLLEDEKFHLTTGFVGTPYLAHVLSDSGKSEYAYKLLFQQDYPSWLYQITKGATTIWEHWDGIKPDGSFWSADMNSFNHYSYGAIGDWLYRSVAGIRSDEKVPGYKKILIRPEPGEGLSWAEGTLSTLYGTVRSRWQLAGENRMELSVSIPANTAAEIHLPLAPEEGVTESGAALGTAAGVRLLGVSDEGVAVETGSGEYVFSYALTRPLTPLPQVKPPAFG